MKLIKGVYGLSLATLLSIFVVNTLGFLDTVTGSALGCGRDWPTCNGQLIPSVWDRAVVIEYTHRLSVLAAAILVVLLTVVSLRKYGRIAEIRLYVILLLGTIVVEGALGAISVLFVNPPAVMAAHMGISLLSFASVFLLTVAIPEQERLRDSGGLYRSMRSDPLDRRIVNWSLIMPIYAYAAIYLGAYVAYTGAGVMFSGWLIPMERGEGYGQALLLDSLHRLVALVFLLAAIRILFLTHRVRRNEPFLYRGAWWMLVFVLLQMASGIYLVETHVSQTAFMLHVTNASFLFVAVFYFAMRARHAQRSNATRYSSE